MDELNDREQDLLLQVLDGVILQAMDEWMTMENGTRREKMKVLCSDLARLGLHLLDIMEPESPPTVH